MTSREVRQHCGLDAVCLELLQKSVQEMGLSARAHDKVLRLARTIADLDRCESIREPHIQEAINYRMLDRQFWS